MSTSAACSSACSTLMCPAGLHTLPAVIFHRRTRPSFPEDERTVLHDQDRSVHAVHEVKP